jgi:hypothetical protein
MNKLIMILALVLTSAASAYAQPPDTEQPVQLASDVCLLNTTDEAWTALGLSAEQLEQVKSVQTLCETDCTAMQESGQSDPALAQAMLDKHRENIRSVLTKEQYDKWLTWCDDRPAKG